jgi:hypothetical protein
VAALTEEEKATVVGAAGALRALRERLKALPPDAADFGEKIKQGSVALENFRDHLAQAVSRSPVLAAAMDAVGKSVLGAFGPGQQGVVTATVHIIEQFAVVAARVAEGIVIGAGVMVQAWYIVKTVLLGIETVVAGVVAANVMAIAGVIDLAAKVPGVGDKLLGVKLAADNLRDSMKGATGSLADQTAEAAKGAAGHSELQAQLEKVAGVVANVGDAMEAASGQTVKLGDTFPPIVPKVKTVTGAIKDHAKEIADTLRKLSQDIALDQKEGLEKRLLALENEKQNEIAKAKELTGGVGTAYAQMVTLIEQRTAQRVAIERAAGDEIKQHELQLQQEHDLSLATGTQRQLMEIQIKEQAELQSIERLRLTRAADFEQMSALIHQKFADATAVITGHYATVEQLAQAAGVKTRAQLDESLAKAKDDYRQMQESHAFSQDAMKQKREEIAKAEEELDGHVRLNAQEQWKLIGQSVSTILSSIFGRSKALAIATAIIDTIASAVAAFKHAGGWPLGAVAAAASLAYGYAQVQQIRNQNAPSGGFATGTPGLDFMNFGSATSTVLHGSEAVIPRGGGHVLAGEIASGLGRGQAADPGMLDELRAMRGDLSELPRRFARSMRDTMLLAMV